MFRLVLNSIGIEGFLRPLLFSGRPDFENDPRILCLNQMITNCYITRRFALTLDRFVVYDTGYGNRINRCTIHIGNG